MHRNAEARRITALVAMIAILFVMFFSIEYISRNVEHDCTGNDCPICAMIEQCSNNIKTGGAATAVLAAVSLLSISLIKSIECNTSVCFNTSLITQKVRMNN